MERFRWNPNTNNWEFHWYSEKNELHFWTATHYPWSNSLEDGKEYLASRPELYEIVPYKGF